MARRRKRTRETEVRENGPELLWILLGLGVLGTGAVVYVATRPKPAPAATGPTQAQVDAAVAQATQAGLNLIPAQVGDQIPDNVSTALQNGGSTGPVNTGNSDIDNAAN